MQDVYKDLLLIMLHCVKEEGIRRPRDSGEQHRRRSVVIRQRHEKDAGSYLRVL